MVSGGAVAATAIAWGASTASAAADENPFGDVSFGGDTSSSAEHAEQSTPHDSSKWADITKAAERAFTHGSDSDSDSDSEAAEKGEAGDADTGGADSEDTAKPADTAPAGEAGPDDAATADDAEDAAKPAVQGDSTGTAETKAVEPVADEPTSKLKAAHQNAKRAWQRHVAEPTRAALHEVGNVLRSVGGLGGGLSGVDSPDVDVPSAPAPELDGLPKPEGLPLGAGEDGRASAQTESHDADARAPGASVDELTTSAVSDSDAGESWMSGAERAGNGAFDAAGAEHSDAPTKPVGPEKNRHVPAPMPTQSSHVTAAPADAPTGAAMTAADPFAASAVGALVRSGHSLSSMSPGSQPGVTPD
ncbi:hypothetical protein BJF85_06050 [Saccharomonospora sp. CUA-673]|nr:hypothetical protein BJF85_06050 [Saccharomonospora sp. CUA-673]